MFGIGIELQVELGIGSEVDPYKWMRVDLEIMIDERVEGETGETE